MKSFLFFGLLLAALNIYSGAFGSEEETELKMIQPSADIQERELTPLLDRSRTARDAGKKKNGKGKKNKGGKGKKKGGKKVKKGKKGLKKNAKKTKKAGKKNGDAKKKSGKSKNKNKKEKKKSGKTKNKGGKKNKKSKKGQNKSGNLKQADATCVTNIIAKTKKYRLYTTQLKKIKNIKRNVARSQSKKDKAGTAFESVLAAMKESTNGGKGCEGNSSASADGIAAYNTLSNCSKTAAAMCDVSLNTTADALLTECETSLSAAIAPYELCLKNTDAVAACACFQALTLVDAKCEDWEAVNQDILEKAKKCVSVKEAGSFAVCRKSEQAAAYLGTQCKAACPVATTKAPAGGKNLMRRQYFNSLRRKLI